MKEGTALAESVSRVAGGDFDLGGGDGDTEDRFRLLEEGDETVVAVDGMTSGKA